MAHDARPVLALLAASSLVLNPAFAATAQHRPGARPPIPTLMREALVPGLQIAVISSGRVGPVRAFGTANIDTRQPVTAQTVFEAASLGKPLFAYGVLKLASAGRLDLNAPVRRYLPDLEGPAGQLTARQLLSHTGGLPNGRGSLDVSAADVGRFSYSGEGYGLLQRVVEAITRQPLNEYMRTAVFGPLGMASSSYVWREEYRNTKAFGHGVTGANAGRSHIPTARAQSSLETTTGDYARFMLAAVKGQGLDRRLAREMWRPQVRLESACVECLGKPRTALSQTMSWGLGWGIATTRRGPFAWHWGDNNTMQAYAAIALDGSRGVVIFANSANGHSIMRAAATQTLGVEAPGYAGIDVYAQYTDPARRLLARIVHSGPAALAPADLTLPRPDLIQVTERLLQGGKASEAAWLVAHLPGGPGTADELALLAEAERKAGRQSDAQRHARAALQSDPKNKPAATVIEKIAMARRSIPDALLDHYAGKYESPFGPLTVTRNGRHLLARFEDQPSSEMLPTSDSRFLIDSMGLPIEFVQDANGKITHALVQAGSIFTLRRL